MIILGLESSCDETAAALVTADKTILAESLASQTATHRAFGGVVPEVAARAHLTHMPDLVRSTLNAAKLQLPDITAIAATCGPGLIGGVMVGMMTGKAMAAALGKPFIAINHLAAHALSPRLVADVPFPYLLLLVSGGHCQLVMVHSATSFTRLGTTIDDAAGEAYDKVAKLLGLGYPGGPVIDALAQQGNAARFIFPVPLKGTAVPNFSFSGLKTAVRLQVEKLGPLTDSDKADIAAGFQQAVVHSMVDRTSVALKIAPQPPTALVVAGGVAANSAIRAALTQLAATHGLPFIAPPQKLCTDNAAMIAWAGVELFSQGLAHDLNFAARPRWPLDESAAPTKGGVGKA